MSTEHNLFLVGARSFHAVDSVRESVYSADRSTFRVTVPRASVRFLST